MNDLFIETDLESDDLLAIYILLCRGYNIRHVVVGEGDSCIKYERMKVYWTHLHNEFPSQISSVPSILHGMSSSKPFSNDGFDISSNNHDIHELRHRAMELKEIKHSKSDDVKTNEYRLTLMSFIEHTNRPLIIALKPMRELFKVWKDIPSELLRKTTLVDYGSFNYRCLWGKDPKEKLSNSNLLLEMLSQFKKHILYESFLATGLQNSMNKENMSNVYDSLQILSKTSHFLQCLFRLISQWNSHLVKQCRDNISKYDLIQEKLQWQIDAQDRSRRIITSIETSIDSQMVLADSALAALLDDENFQPSPTPVNISFDDKGGSYTKVTAVLDDKMMSTSTYSYLNIPFTSIQAKFQEILVNRIAAMAVASPINVTCQLNHPQTLLSDDIKRENPPSTMNASVDESNNNTEHIVYELTEEPTPPEYLGKINRVSQRTSKKIAQFPKRDDAIDFILQKTFQNVPELAQQTINFDDPEKKRDIALRFCFGDDRYLIYRRYFLDHPAPIDAIKAELKKQGISSATGHQSWITFSLD